MPSYAQTVFTDLKTHLATITAAGGYSQTIRAVYTGRNPALTVTSDDLPIVIVTPVSDAPDTNPVLITTIRAQKWTRKIQLECFFLLSDHWEIDADHLLDDVRRALTRFPTPMEIGAVEFLPVIDRPDWGAFQMPLQYSHRPCYSFSQ